MDLILELIVGLMVQRVVDLVAGLLELAAIEGAARALQSRQGALEPDGGLRSRPGRHLGLQPARPAPLCPASCGSPWSLPSSRFSSGCSPIPGRVVATPTGWRQLVDGAVALEQRAADRPGVPHVGPAGGALLGYQGH